MSDYGFKFLSKVIDENDPQAFRRLRMDPKFFPTDEERRIYKYIEDYAKANGKAPSEAEVAAEFEGFLYIPGVRADYRVLAKGIKDDWRKRQIADYIRDPERFGKTFRENDAEDLIRAVKEQLDSIEAEADSREQVGIELKTGGSDFLAKYRERKNGESFSVWKSKFPSINDEIGGYYSGNMYTWYGRSGRGKSVITLEEAIESAYQGATVLIWAMEMSRFEVMARAYSSISAREGILRKTIDGVDYESGFENKALLTASLTEEYEQGLETFLSTLSEVIPGEIIVRAADDSDFDNRRIRDLEADILATKADVVVIDPFYYLDYEANTSKTTGGDAANTSEKLRKLAGITKTVIHAITQADEDEKEIGEGGARVLTPPTRKQVKKTKQLPEDSTNSLAIDTLDGQGVICIRKGRNGGEDIKVDITYLPNYGIVREAPLGKNADDIQFEDPTEVF